MTHPHFFDASGFCECGYARCVECSKIGKISKFEIFVCRDDNKARCGSCSEVLSVKIAEAGSPSADGSMLTTECLVGEMSILRQNPTVISCWLDKEGLWIQFAQKKGSKKKVTSKIKKELS